jgi:hypothetical protein
MRALVVLALALLFVACEKQVEENTEPGYISYTLSGKQTLFTGSLETYHKSDTGVCVLRSSGSVPGYSYMINGFGGVTYNRITIVMKADSLAAGSYSSGGAVNFVSTVELKFEPMLGYVFHTGLNNRKPFSVQITKHEAGRLSGSFSGRVFQALNGNNADSVDISGIISNVEVQY